MIIEGKIIKIAGPVIVADGMRGTQMYEVVKVVKNINKENPDIVVFTGDLLFNKIDEDTKNKLINELSKINSKEYKYATLGELDNENAKDILDKSGFIILDNTSEYI